VVTDAATDPAVGAAAVAGAAGSGSAAATDPSPTGTTPAGAVAGATVTEVAGGEVGDALARSPFLLAARGAAVPHTPVWFMRQAGRSLPEYRAIREGTSMLESCMRPDLVVEITLQPVRRYGVDAAILFSDIVLPLKAVGVDLEIQPGVGPVIASPVRSQADLASLRPVTAADVGYVTDAVKHLVTELGPIPLIGFAGAPFTVASYLVEGGPSKDHARTKALIHGDPRLWHALADRLADMAIAYLAIQIEAGAAAIQLFDSWAGALSARDYAEYVQPHSAKVFDALASYGVPRLHFGVNTGELLGLMSAAGADVVGVDWRVPLDEAVRRITADGAPASRSRAISIPPCCPRPGTPSSRRSTASWPRARRRPATSSTSATAYRPRRSEVLLRIVQAVHARSADRA
jgi:uroporphyrinogen decarboxylase